MPEISLGRTGEHLRALFGILIPLPDGLSAGEALSALVARTTLTKYESEDYPSSGRRFEKIVRLATIDCVKAGWLQKQRGRWAITEEGRQAYDEFRDPEQFYRTATSLYRKWIERQPPGPETSGGTEEVEVAKAAAVTLEEAEESSWKEVEQYLHTMNPYDFQDLVGALLKGLGYHVPWTAPRGKDGGIDLIATPDALGTLSPRLKVQVKRQVTAVTVEGLRSFMATLGPTDVGLFVSHGGFTKDAHEEAGSQSTRRVTLIDLQRFYELWLEVHTKLPVEDRRLLPLRPIHFLTLE